MVNQKILVFAMLFSFFIGGAFAINFVETQVDSNVQPVAQEDVVTIAGTIEDGDSYKITINGADSVYSTDGTEADLNAIASELVDAINTNSGTEVTATVGTGANLTIVSDVAGTAFTIAVEANNKPAVAQVDTFEIGGTIEAGDSYTTTIDGNDVVYTLDGTEADLTAVISAIVNTINNNVDVNGTVLAELVDGTHYKVTAKVAGTAFTTAASASDGGSTSDNTLTVANTVANEADGTDDNSIIINETVANVVEVFEKINVAINGTESFGDRFDLIVNVDGTNTSRLYIVSDASIQNNDVLIEELADLFDSVVGVSTSDNGTVISIVSDDSSKNFSLDISISNDGNVTNTSTILNDVKVVGQEAVCNYTGDYSVSAYAWYLDNTVIIGETSQTYTIQSGDEGKDLKCAITLDVADNTVGLYSNEVELADGKLSISNGVAFSVPTCVEFEEMKAYANVTSNDVFVTYTTGRWSNYDGSFKPLVGYKYLGSKTFEMPIINSESCDLSEIKITVSNDWNLLGLNGDAATAADWLWSLTQRSTTNTFIDALYDASGSNICSYADFGANNVQPGNAYWVFYAGEDGQTFSGVSN